MAEKKLTPIQEAIANIELAKITGNFSPQETGVMSSIQRNLQFLLPKEKEFAKDLWDGGVNFSLENMDKTVKKYKEPDFQTYYQQYEP